jgi:hypothetical protein
MHIGKLRSAAELYSCMAEVAPAIRARQRRVAYSRVELNRYTFEFVPFSMKNYGRLGQPAMALLNQSWDKATGTGGVSWASFVAGALREISIELCRGNFLLYRGSLGGVARASGLTHPGLISVRGCMCPQTNL